MNTNIENAAQLDKKEVGLLAYQLWEKAGRPSGKDLDFWLEAEKQLRNAAQPIPTIPIKMPAPTPKPQQQQAAAAATPTVRRPKLSRFASNRRS